MLDSQLLFSFNNSIKYIKRLLTLIMSFVLNRILVLLSLILLLTFLIGCSHGIDVPNANHLAASDDRLETEALFHQLAKRRFLPTRRDLIEQLYDGIDQTEPHSNIKRYFLKTKRDFLDNDQNIN